MYGDITRQVGHIIRDNSENKIPSAPRISVYITSLAMDRERTSDATYTGKIHLRERAYDSNNKEYLNTQGQNYTVERLMPTPFNLGINVDNSSIEIYNDNLRIKSSGITNDMLSGSISNDKLNHHSLTLGSTEVELGGTINSITGIQGLVIDGIEGLQIKSGDNNPGFLEIYESDGLKKIILKGQEILEDININLPSVEGTIISTGDISTVTNTMLSGAISNNKLINSSISLGGVSISLGSSDDTPNFNLTNS